MAVKPGEIATLVELFEQSGWDELHVELNGLQLFLSTDPQARLTGVGASSAATAAGPTADVLSATRRNASAAPLPVVSPATSSASDIPAHWVPVTAPNLGTFYRAPKPGEAPFVEVGRTVEPQTELCLIEVMKLFTTVRAEVAGTIRRICVADTEMVEFGQPLFYIEPA